MKHLFLTIVFCLTAILAVAQSVAAPIYSVLRTNDEWYFLRLNTADGRLWYIYAPENPKFASTDVLNPGSLLPADATPVPGRFAVTTNSDEHIILYDTFDGRTWYVKYNTNSRKVVIVPLNFDESPKK